MFKGIRILIAVFLRRLLSFYVFIFRLYCLNFSYPFLTFFILVYTYDTGGRLIVFLFMRKVLVGYGFCGLGFFFGVIDF